MDIGQSLILNPCGDIKRLTGKGVAHQVIQPLGAMDRDGMRRRTQPGGVDQPAQFQIMIRVVMRDEDNAQLAVIKPGLNKLPRHPETGIDQVDLIVDDDGVAAGPAAPLDDTGAALGAEKHDPVTRHAHQHHGPCHRQHHG
ncbi:MAG: Uncharacterised protein [SAR116 cluster bacterium MED-G04]|nr:MAG: Uncharacterised protein [SAR116 cluster bacterium MED-G04]